MDHLKRRLRKAPAALRDRGLFPVSPSAFLAYYNASGDWAEDWRAFSRVAAERIHSGDDDQALTEFFAGQTVRWRGEISELRLDAEYAAGVAMAMPRFRTRILEGYVFTSDYAFASVTDRTRESWRAASVGDTVEFECEIGAGDDIFPGVRAVRFDEDQTSHVQQSLTQARLLRIV